MTLPRPVKPFVDFASVLRSHGFTISPDQTIGFIQAIGLLGPRDMGDIFRAARAMLAIPHERADEFEALFRAFFMGQTIAAPVPGADDEDEVQAYEAGGGEVEIEEAEGEEETGGEATVAERLSRRSFAPRTDDEALLNFSRLAPKRLPRRRSYRHQRAAHGKRLDMRRTLREAVKRDGEVFTLAETRRKTRQRRIVLLIDVSGSMKDHTDGALRFAHALGQSAVHFEAFTLGTRLTRITPALAISDREQALTRVSALVADIDGGTRIGDALQAFVNVPRYAGAARGAAVVVLSDGLERGDAYTLLAAVRRLSRMAWRLDWLTPLAADPDYSPQTEALRLILPWLNNFGDGSRTTALCDHFLTMARAA
jgi:uncharacterized protein with von Willebrand factor type A (vWA) domain